MKPAARGFWRLQGPLVLLVAGLEILGVVNDPTTEGLGDSKQAMGYNYPKRK